MAELQPDNLPMIDPPLAGRAPSLEGEVTDRGPEWIDRETVELVASRVQAGLVTLPNTAEPALAGASQDQVSRLFAQKLATSPLSSRFTAEHRAYALIATLSELAVNFASGPLAAPPLRPDLEQTMWATTNLERQLAELRPLVGAIFEEAPSSPLVTSVCSKLAMIDTARLAKLTGLSEASFVAWRKLRRGPRWVEVPMPSGNRSRVLYPISGVLVWLYNGAS